MVDCSCGCAAACVAYAQGLEAKMDHTASGLLVLLQPVRMLGFSFSNSFYRLRAPRVDRSNHRVNCKKPLWLRWLECYEPEGSNASKSSFLRLASCSMLCYVIRRLAESRLRGRGASGNCRTCRTSQHDVVVCPTFATNLWKINLHIILYPVLRET